MSEWNFLSRTKSIITGYGARGKALPKWKIGNLTVRGPRTVTQTRQRALIFCDSFGPSVQINFLLPLAFFGKDRSLDQSPIRPWDVWVVTEKGSECTDGPVSDCDLERLVATLRPNVIVSSRYAGTLAGLIVRIAATSRIPLVAHIDDNLFEVPETDAPAGHSRHAHSVRKARLAAQLKAADLDYISTGALSERLRTLDVLGPKVYIGKIAGAASPSTKSKTKSDTGVVFGYMGSRSHIRDLEMVAPAIAAALHEFPAARFQLFGSIDRPTALEKFPVTHYPKIGDYTRFRKKLDDFNWDFGLAPLIENDFTRMKTNIKWIEYTSSGIPVVASAHPIYASCCADGAGLLVEPTGWHAALSQMIQSSDLRKNLYRTARLRLTKDYTPEQLHDQVMAAFAAAGATHSSV